MAEQVAPVVQEGRCGPLVWAVCATACPGQARSGDGFAVEGTDVGALAAVVDGLGHGEEAADAAERALASVRAVPGRSPSRVLAACHAALRGSRGAVMTVAAVDLDHHRLEWVAVGNVEAAVLRAGRGGAPVRRWSVPLRAGVVGERLPPLRESTVDLAPGDIVVMATDGLSPDFLDGVDLTLSVRTLAGRVHRDFARADDDALVLVVRCGGRAG